MNELAKCTWHEAAGLFTDSTVFLLPVGSTEPHGPHLPLDTDVTIATAQARRAAELLATAGVGSVVLPALPFGLTDFTAGFPGRVGIRPGTLWALLEDVVSSLAEQGVQRIVLSNGHLEPEHVRVLRGVILDHAERGPGRAQVLFPDNTRRRWAATLGEEFVGGDCHAGRYESSLVLATDPDSVRDSERRRLPVVTIGLLERLREGVRSFRDAGADEAYCGDPAAASVEEGLQLVERLAEMIVATVREAWPDLFAA